MDSFTREQISKGMFSSDQEDYMRDLANTPAWKKCASGWHFNEDPAKCRCGPGPEAPPSAYLLDAAPDLLAACEALLEAPASKFTCDDPLCRICLPQALARAAINKAKGL